MSDKSIKDGLSAITSEVLGDVLKEAEDLILNAQARAKETLRIAKENADQIYKAMVDEASAKTQAEKRRAESLTEVDLRNRVLQTKEALVDKAFEEALAKLQEYVKTNGYHEKLLKFVEEAAKKLGSKNLVVLVNSADRAWLSQETLSTLSKKLQIRLELAAEPENCSGGYKVQTADGKLMYDNTIENRVQQLKAELRLEAAKILFEEEVGDNSR